MPIPSETALRTRARSLLEAMQACGRWVYAVPREEALAQVRELLGVQGFSLETMIVEGSGERLEAARGETRVLLEDRSELEVAILDASGPDAPEVLGALLDKTGFFAQSTLLRTAYDLSSEEASEALGTLAFMVMRWDARWAELFRSHLDSPEEEQRSSAARALRVASQLVGPSETLRAFLEEARARAKDEALGAALASL
jgi:hypothetical protein